MVVATGGSQGHLSGAACVEYPVSVLVWAVHGVLWKLGEEEGAFPERLCGFGCWGRLSQLFSPSLLVSYSKARKEACGLRQCQTPL